MIRMLLLALASLGYFANGAQAHLHVAIGETLELQLCGTGTAHSITLEIPGEPVQESTETCCGDCLLSVAILAPPVEFRTRAPARTPAPAYSMPAAVSPRSPLWPGAPPHGPPAFLKA